MPAKAICSRPRYQAVRKSCVAPASVSPSISPSSRQDERLSPALSLILPSPLLPAEKAVAGIFGGFSRRPSVARRLIACWSLVTSPLKLGDVAQTQGAALLHQARHPSLHQRRLPSIPHPLLASSLLSSHHTPAFHVYPQLLPV
jgi:hypothetical protein